MTVMPDLIGHLALSAGRVYRKTASHGPPPVNAAPFWPKNRHSPLRVYTQKPPKSRFRVNVARPVRPDLMPSSCPTRSGISQIMEYTDKGSAEALPEARRTEEDYPIGY